MTNFNKSTLKTFFETGDVPAGQQYADLIDSNVNLVETAIQNMAGPLFTTELVATRVSATDYTATNLSTTGTMSLNAGSRIILNASSSRIEIKTGGDLLVSAEGSITITASADVDLTATAGDITITASGNIALQPGTAVRIFSDISAESNTIYVSAVRSTRGMFAGVGIVSAAGTTQGTAASLTNVINRGKGIVDGTTTGFTPLANRAGLVQYLFNEGASANLWPPTGGFINGLAVNAAFPLATSAMVTIVHLTASAYAVK